MFGAEVLPRIAVSNAALEYALDQIAANVDSKPRDAVLVRNGLRIASFPTGPGAQLDRDAAAETIVRTLGQLERAPGAAQLPVRAASPSVTAVMLAAPAETARRAISRPSPSRLPGAASAFPGGAWPSC